MPVKITLPALSPTMTEGKISSWRVKEGDKVKAGDIVAEVETDKATMEIEAPESGTIGKIVVNDLNEMVKVAQTIALILEEGEGKDALNGVETSSATSANNQATAPQAAKTAPSAPITVFQSAPEYKGKYVPITVRAALKMAMVEEMRRDSNVFLMGEEVAQYQGAYKISAGMLEEFGPDRVIDTPITEYGFTGLGVGSAMMGLRPIVEYMNFTFAMQAIEHIVNSAAKIRYMSAGIFSCPIVFRGLNGTTARVAATHAQDFASWFAHIPGLIVVAPWSSEDAKGLLKSAIRNDNPVVFLESEVLYGQTFDCPEGDDFLIPLGKAKVEKSGKDVTIVSYALPMSACMEAAAELEKIGISAEVINLRTIRPLDIDTIVESVKKTNHIVTVEDGWLYSGVGSEIATQVMEKAFDYLDAPVARVAIKDVPMPFAKNLEAATIVSKDDVIVAVKSLLGK